MRTGGENVSISSELLHKWHSLEAMPCRSKEQDQELDELRGQLIAAGWSTKYWQARPKARANAPQARISATGYCAQTHGWTADFVVTRDAGGNPIGLAVARFTGQIKTHEELAAFNALMAQAFEEVIGRGSSHYV